MIYRFSASLLFFNADHFRTRTRALIAAEPIRPSWFILDAESIPLLDITGAAALEEFRSELSGQGVVLAIARASGLFRIMLERSGVAGAIGKELLFPTVRAGTEAFLASQPATIDSAESKAS
jgi:MFS superfamily sulfate permease-like transporter